MIENKNMDILLLSSLTIPHHGGVSSHMLLLRNALQKKGYSVGLEHIGEVETKLNKVITAASAMIRMRNVRAEVFTRKVRYLKCAAQKAKSPGTIFHAHNVLASVATIGLGCPTVTTVHGPMYEHARESGIHSKSLLDTILEYEKNCFEHSDHLIAVDEGQKALLLEKGVPTEKITVIQNAVDVDALSSAETRKPSQLQGDYFIMSRRLTPKNGPLVAVKAFLDWVGSRDIQFAIAGDGRMKEQLRECLDSHENGKKVLMLGSLDHSELLPLLKGARASVVPSIPFEGVVEATSLSALESLALDVPVIASDIGGLSDIDSGNGVMTLVPPGDQGALSHAFEHWASKNKFDLGKTLSSYVRERFGVNKWLQSHLDVYAKLNPESFN